MLEFLKTWVLTIISLVMFIVLIEMILPSGKIRKMINMVSGFMLIAAMINPVLNLFGKSVDFKGISFETAYFPDQQSIEKNSKIFSEKQNSQILYVYRQNITAKLREICEAQKEISFVNAEIQLTEDPSSKTFGEIRAIYLDIAEGKTGNNEIVPIKPVTQIKIDRSEATEKKSPVNSSLTEKVEELIGKAFELDSDKIIINISDSKQEIRQVPGQ